MVSDVKRDKKHTKDELAKENRSKHGRDMKKENCRDKKPLRFEKLEFDESTCSIKAKGEVTLKDIRSAFKNFTAVEENGGDFVLRYPSKEHALVDMKMNRRFGGRKEEERNEYLDNKYILTNLSYKETAESISKVFGKYGEIERIVIKKNKDGMFVGKAIITFKNRTTIRDEIVMSSKPIYMEKIRKPLENKTRLFLGNLKKSHSVVAIRKILADAGCRPRDIRVLYGSNRRNRGYGFVEYGDEEDACRFISKFEEMKDLLGPGCFYEYSNEKIASRKGRR